MVERPVKLTATSGALIGKGNFAHFMLKEIYEQPAVIGDTLHGLLNPWNEVVVLPPLSFDPTRISKLTLIGCGTSYHAALVAKYWFERIARIPTEVDIASEFRYRGADMPAGRARRCSSRSRARPPTRWRRWPSPASRASTSSASSTSGELDGPAGRRGAADPRRPGDRRRLDQGLHHPAHRARLPGHRLRRQRGKIDRDEERKLCRALTEVPSRANEVLNHDQRIAEIARTVAEARDVLYLGRGTGYPIALEGALKLKEISYIHAEGYAAGEMKHGPIALIDENMPIIVIAPSDSLFDKTASNMQEVIARGGKVIFLSDAAGIERLGDVAAATVELPAVDPFVAPILYTIPIQLLAYHVAVLKGTDVDQPRNLAKSVTVE